MAWFLANISAIMWMDDESIHMKHLRWIYVYTHTTNEKVRLFSHKGVQKWWQYSKNSGSQLIRSWDHLKMKRRKPNKNIFFRPIEHFEVWTYWNTVVSNRLFSI